MKTTTPPTKRKSNNNSNNNNSNNSNSNREESPRATSHKTTTTTTTSPTPPPSYYYSLRQLPIHVACSNLFRHVDARLREQLEKLITHLVVVHPEGCLQVDHEGRLPLHEAIWHNCTAATVSILLMAAPATIHARDKYGKSPLELNLNRCAAITNFVGNSNSGGSGSDHEPTIPSTGTTAGNMALSLQQLQEQRRIHDLLQKGVQFWEHARQEAMLRMKHGGKPPPVPSSSQGGHNNSSAALNASLHSLGVKSVDSISVLAASSLNSEGSSHTLWTADQSRDYGRAGSLTDNNNKNNNKKQQQAITETSDQASSVPSSAATQMAVRTSTSPSIRSLSGNKDDNAVEPLAWSQLEQRCLQLEQLLTEMYETNFELGEVIGGLTRKKIELEDELELLVGTDFAREAVSMRDDNMNLRKEIVRLQLLLQEHGIQDKKRNSYQNAYVASASDNTQLEDIDTQMEDIDPERRVEVIQYLDAKNRMLQQQVDEWTRSSHKFQRKSEQLEMVINSLQNMEDESVVTSKEEGSIASRSILETLKTDSSDATERYLAKKLTELDDRLAEAKLRSEEEQAVSREERLRLMRENEALVSELKTVATSRASSPSMREKTNSQAVSTSNDADFSGNDPAFLDISWGKAATVSPSVRDAARSTTIVSEEPLEENRYDSVDEELDAIIRETEKQTGLTIAPELVFALRQVSFRKDANDSGPIGDSSFRASRRFSFSSYVSEQPTLSEDELMSLIAEAERESGLTIPAELISALRRTSLSNASYCPDPLSPRGDLVGTEPSLVTPQAQLASNQVTTSPTKRSTPSASQDQGSFPQPILMQAVEVKIEDVGAKRKQTDAVLTQQEARKSPREVKPSTAVPSIAMMAAREKKPQTARSESKPQGEHRSDSDVLGSNTPAEFSTLLSTAVVSSRPSQMSEAPSVSSYHRPLNDEELDFFLREIEREFGEPIPPDVIHALRRASTFTMLSSLSGDSGIDSQESISHASYGKREFTSLATSTSPLSDAEVDRMLTEAERLLGRPLSNGLMRAIHAASASITTPSSATYIDESPKNNEKSGSEAIAHQELDSSETEKKHFDGNEHREVKKETDHSPNSGQEIVPDTERDMQSIIQEAEILYGGPLSPDMIAALKNGKSATSSDSGGSATDTGALLLGEDDIESIIREAERLQGMPLSEDLVKALRALSLSDNKFDASDSYFREVVDASPEKRLSSDQAAAFTTNEMQLSQKVSPKTGRSPRGNAGKLDKLLSPQSTESKTSAGDVSRPLQPPERQLSTFTLVSVSSGGSNDLQDVSGFQGQLDQVSEVDNETYHDDADQTEISDSDLALLIENAYESQGRTVPADLLNAISAASIQDADDPEDFDGVISEVERLYGKALPSDVTDAVREASQLPHLGDVDELDIVLEEAERMYGGQLSSFVKRAWREPSSAAFSEEFVEEAKRIYGNPIPDELSEALLIGVSQSSLDLGIDQELDRIILDAEQMYGAELPSDFISALRQASVRFSSSRFSLRSLLDTMDMPSISEESPLIGGGGNDNLHHS
jgi:hypothetical protein